MTDSHGGMAGCMHGRRGHVLWLTTRLVLIRALYFCIGGNYLGVYFVVRDIILIDIYDLIQLAPTSSKYV